MHFNDHLISVFKYFQGVMRDQNGSFTNFGTIPEWVGDKIRWRWCEGDCHSGMGSSGGSGRELYDTQAEALSAYFTILAERVVKPPVPGFAENPPADYPGLHRKPPVTTDFNPKGRRASTRAKEDRGGGKRKVTRGKSASK